MNARTIDIDARMVATTMAHAQWTREGRILSPAIDGSTAPGSVRAPMTRIVGCFTGRVKKAGG